MPYAALKELLDLAEMADLRERPGTGEVTIAGADPVFPTRFRAGTAGAAALAATGLAASELWRLRTGRRQRVAVDLRAAAASLRSGFYLRLDGDRPAGGWDRLSGFYPTRDGWVFVHCNFPHHGERAAGVLGGVAEREAMAQASRGWDGAALEAAVITAGGCAGFVRTADAWAEHPQAEVIASLPALEIRRIGDAPSEPLPAGDRPLAGVRVLDLTRVLAGPTCARTLAEHGAEVLKITAPHLPDSGAVELDTGLGKRAAFLDLRQAADAETLRTLVREADVFSQSYRPGALAGRGFSPAELAALRPGIVYVTLSAWGHAGAWRDRRGFDSIVQCVSGMTTPADDGKPPKLMPMSAIDYVSGYLMAFGVMAALARRAREGGSWLVRVSLAGTGRWIAERGLVDPAALAGLAPDLTPEEIARLTMETPAPQGRVRHLRPIVQMSETPGRWDRPPVPLGTHPPAWPA